MLIEYRARVFIGTRAIEMQLSCQFFAHEPGTNRRSLFVPPIEEGFILWCLDADVGLRLRPFIACFEHFELGIFGRIDIDEENVSCRFEHVVEEFWSDMGDGEYRFHLG